MSKITIIRNCQSETIIVSDVQTYLDELPPENITEIDVRFCKLTNLSNLSRFTNLVKLNCAFNELVTLPVLPRNLKVLVCYRNKLSSLPDLPKSLIILFCNMNNLTLLPLLPETLILLLCCRNQLIRLPTLPNTLKQLYCSGNRLTSLPELSDSLEWLECENNQLTTLPVLPESLEGLACNFNPITNIIEVLIDDINNIILVRSTINTLNRFKHLYYCLRFKLKFNQWFLRANERKLMEQNHPDKITALLASGVDVLEL